MDLPRIRAGPGVPYQLPDNVYIASAWGKIGGGFSGAMVGGYMSAMEVLRKS